MSGENTAQEIIPKLWLGDGYIAENKEWMEETDIAAVVNATPDLKNYFSHWTVDDELGLEAIEYMRIPVEDDLKKESYALMGRYLIPAVAFIHKNLVIEKKRMLIHCHAGMQRSAAIVAAYLMVSRRMSLDDAINLIISKREVAFHNGESINFDLPLEKLEKQLGINPKAIRIKSKK